MRADAQGSPSSFGCRHCKARKIPIESDRAIPIVLADGSTSTTRSSVLICTTCDTASVGAK